MSNKEIISASDITIEYIEIISAGVSINLIEYVISLNVYEDIYSNSLTVDVLLNDSVNLPAKTPILGEEYLNFSFTSKSIDSNTTGTGSSSIDPGPMYTVSITDRHITKDRQQIFILHCVSEQGIINSNTTISKSYNGKKVYEIVNNILDEYIYTENDYVVEETVGIESVVIPNWKPFEAINWLSKRACNKKNIPNFLFWESIGSTHFQSIEQLLEQKVKQKFVLQHVSDDPKKVQSIAAGVIPLNSLEIINQFNIDRNIQNGMYASKLITHDIVRKKIEQSTYGLNQAYGSEITHTDEFMPISSAETYYYISDRQSFAPETRFSDNTGENIQSYYDSRIIFKTKHNQMYAKNIGDLHDNMVETKLLKRNALLLGLDQIKLKVIFPGLSFLRVGHLVHVNVPSPEKVLEEKPGLVKNKEDLNDKYLSGKYLITALKHTVDMINGKPQYTMVAELSKDGLGYVPAYGGKL
jgi:hypothetical protein